MKREVILDTGIVAYTDSSSDGPPILFIHGNSLSSSIFNLQFSSLLTDKYRLIAIDMPGHGSSGGATDPERVYSFQGFGAVVADFIKALDLKGVILAGVSLGGHIAIEATSMCNEIRGIVISGAPPAGHPFDIEKAYLMKPEELAPGLKGTLTEDEAAGLTTALLQCDGGEAWKQIKAEILSTDPLMRSCLGKSIMEGKYLDEIKIVRELALPVAVLHGKREGVVNGEYFDTIEIPTLWRGSVQMIPGAGHMPQLDNPDYYNKVISEFASEIFQ